MISCNVVKTEEFDANNQVQMYEETLQSSLLLVKEIKRFYLTRFNFAWFKINSPCEDLIFYFRDFNNQIIKKGIKVCLIFHLK